MVFGCRRGVAGSVGKLALADSRQLTHERHVPPQLVAPMCGGPTRHGRESNPVRDVVKELRIRQLLRGLTRQVRGGG